MFGSVDLHVMTKDATVEAEYETLNVWCLISTHPVLLVPTQVTEHQLPFRSSWQDLARAADSILAPEIQSSAMKTTQHGVRVSHSYSFNLHPSSAQFHD